jgi:hypothetical protein
MRSYAFLLNHVGHEVELFDFHSNTRKYARIECTECLVTLLEVTAD